MTKSMDQKELFSSTHLRVILRRLACQLVENHDDFSHTALVGIQPRGVILKDRLINILKEEYGIKNLLEGNLDITFFRDDIRRRPEPPRANQTKIDFLIDDLNLVLIDDVLHTGRSIRAALSALNSFGRPRKIELLVLIDRRFSRDLPIQPDYKGLQADVISSEKVVLDWNANQGEGGVFVQDRG